MSLDNISGKTTFQILCDSEWELSKSSSNLLCSALEKLSLLSTSERDSLLICSSSWN